MIDVFVEIGVVIMAATLLGYLGRFLKQPSIIAYIAAGILIGPVGLKIINNSEVISLFSELGIIFLLFIVGLQLDFKKLRDVGTPALVIGVGQIVFTAILGYSIARIWFVHLTALYIAVALTLSSTVVVVKLLLDSKQIATLHGRIALGVLLVQDIFAIFAMIFFTTIGHFTPQVFLTSSLKLVIFFGAAVAATVFLVPHLFRYVGRNLELLFLAGLSWAFIVALSGELLGFSTVVGAFIAGITLASTPYALEISGRMKPLRDFFVTIFFVALGMQIVLEPLKLYALPVILLTLFVLIGNPLIMLIITGLYGYHKRTAFMVSLSLAQISEFSLIIVTLGFSLGHIPAEIVSIIATIATLTIGLSTYFVIYDKKLYRLCRPLLFWKSRRHHGLGYESKKPPEVILCGYNRMGYAILRKLKKLKKRVLVIDFNPDTIKMLMNLKTPCIYGDVSDPEVIDRMHLDKVELCVSTILHLDDNLLLLKRLKQHGHALRVFTGHSADDALYLYKNGADYVIIPHLLGGDHFSSMLSHVTRGRFQRYKKKHLKELYQRKKLGHDKPKQRK
jgi:Kef-type K+ transport system membrane component KefB